jgi:PAS domain S-box-containing protein
LIAQLPGASGAVLAQEALVHADLDVLSKWVREQPSWSDFPFILLCSRDVQPDASVMRALANVTVLERPMHQTTLLSAVQAEMRARQRQFEAGAQLAEQLQIRSALAEETRTLSILSQLGAALSENMDLQRIVQLITDAGVQLSGAEFGAFFYNVLDEQGERYTLYTLSGAPRSAFENFPMPRNTAVFHPTFSGEGVLRSGDITADARYGANPPFAGMPKGHLPVCSYLAVPVISRSGDVLGGLFLGHSQKEVFTEASERLIVGVAGHAAAVIDNARLFSDLKRQRDEFYALADNIPSLCWVARADGHVYWYNRRWFEYTGTRLEDQAGWGWQSVHDPRVLPEVMAKWRHSLASGERFEMIFPLKGHDGMYRHFLTRVLPIRDEAGKIIRWFGTNTDITERREAEAALEARVATRTRDLEEALARLQAEAVERERMESALRQSQKLEAIGQLTGGVAHDFNNLLTVIRSSVEFLRREDLPEHRRRRYIDAIAITSERAASLTAHLLAFARRQPLRSQVFDIAEKVEATVEMLRTVVGSRIKLKVESAGAIFVKADAVQFETALINMAVNSRDAMQGEGEITIRIVATEGIPPLRGNPALSGAYAMVSLSDTGSGIPPRLLDRIFEPFFTTKEVGKGTGLGLSQVYGFAKQSGGDIRVESHVGEGTTFTLYLPRASHAELTIFNPEVPEGQEGPAQGRVLMIEDNEQVGEYAAQMLEDLGYSVELVGDAASALSLLEKEPHGFDVVFSDVVLPGPIDGVQLARLLARRRPDLPVVLTTGYSDALTDGLDAGIELLRKPYSVEMLSRLMASVIGQRARKSDREHS